MIIVQIIVVPLCISHLGATGVLNRSTLQSSNPDRANVRPIGMNPNRAREQPMRTGPVAWLSGIQVAEGEVLHGSRQDRRGPHFTRHAILDPPPPLLKVEWQGGSGIHLSTIDQGEFISTVRELHVRFRTPPPTAKGRTTRGLRNETSVVDLGGWILAIQIYSSLILMRIHAPA
jgi:hypothetical protein